ncbi:MAG: 1-acyl-sn-glycerol-3-phosphate acyltransferase [Proteobacteria bacterium]|nr:1-acyl-sn-glycerol-3-phosphate acyltransferase [Pseudomonadota bacterium]
MARVIESPGLERDAPAVARPATRRGRLRAATGKWRTARQGWRTARQGWRSVRMTVHLAAGLATTVFVFPLVSTDGRRARVRSWSARLLRILAVDVRMEGALPPQGNLLVVANHISWLDIFVLNAIGPMRFVAKAELARWPAIGRLIRNVGTLFVERARRHDAHRVTVETRDALAAGDIVAVFPEGTTTDGGTVLPFKSSLLQPIVDAKGALLPIAFRYRGHDGGSSTAAAYAGDTSFFESFWSICGERSLVVELVVTDALPAALRRRHDLAREAEEAIRAALVR